MWKEFGKVLLALFGLALVVFAFGATGQVIWNKVIVDLFQWSAVRADWWHGLALSVAWGFLVMSVAFVVSGGRNGGSNG